MVDFGTFSPERPFQELVLKKLRPGDIYTTPYLDAVPMLDVAGAPCQLFYLRPEKASYLDVDNGGGSFLFRQAVLPSPGVLCPTLFRQICN